MNRLKIPGKFKLILIISFIFMILNENILGASEKELVAKYTSLIEHANYLEEIFISDTIELKIPFEFLISNVKNIYITNDKKILLTDYFNNSLLMFDSTGSFIRCIGRKGRGPGEYIRPWYFGTDSHGKIIIADFTQFRITICTKNGDYLHSFNAHHLFHGLLISPLNDNIIIHDHENARLSGLKSIFVYDQRGNLLHKFGEASEISKKLKNIPFRPPGPYITMFKDKIYEAEFPSYQVKMYNLQGKLIKKFGHKPRYWRSLLKSNYQKLSPQMVTPKVQKELLDFFKNDFTKCSIINWITVFDPDILCMMAEKDQNVYFIFYDDNGNLIRDDLTFENYPISKNNISWSILPISQNGFCFIHIITDLTKEPLETENFEEKMHVILFKLRKL